MVRPASTVPTVNPFTGRAFHNDAEKQQFMKEQEDKQLVVHNAQVEQRKAREEAIAAIVRVFERNGVSEEQVRLAFGPRVFR